MLRAGDCVWLAALALLLMGVVMVRSAGLAVQGAGAELTPLAVLLSKPTLYAGLALAALFVVSRLPVERVFAGSPSPPAPLPAGEGGSVIPLPQPLSQRERGDGQLAKLSHQEASPSPPAPLPAGAGGSVIPLPQPLSQRERGASAVLVAGTAAILLLCLAVYLPSVGREVNGAHRWVGLRLERWGLIGFQPSEVAKWGLLALIAWWAGRMGVARLRKFGSGLFPALAAAGLIAAVIAVEDLGTGALIALAACAALVAAGARLWHFAALAPAGLAGLVGFIALEPYRVQRLTAFLDPFADPQGAGYHMIQSMAAVSSGGLWGRGLGFGLHKFGYLPEDTTDFLFAIIAEELGFVGALVVVALYLAMLLAGARIIARERLLAMRVLAVGVLATIAAQATINIAAVTGLGPTKGIALPLLSSGGTGWVLTAAALGVLVGMDRRAAALEAASGATPGRACAERPALA